MSKNCKNVVFADFLSMMFSEKDALKGLELNAQIVLSMKWMRKSLKRCLVKVTVTTALAVILGASFEFVLARREFPFEARVPAENFEEKFVCARQSRVSVLPKRPYNILVVGCSFTEAHGTSPDGNHVSMLNEIVPNCYFDNAARNGAGPLRCLRQMQLGLKKRHYDGVLYLFIANHLMRDFASELGAPLSEGFSEPRSTLLAMESYELQTASGKPELTVHPMRNIIWPGDDRLRTVNFFKQFLCDAWFRTKNWRNHNYLRMGPYECRQHPEFLERFRLTIEAMNDLCRKNGAKFGVVALDGIGSPYSLDELIPHSEDDYREAIPALNAAYPIEFVPYSLRRYGDTCCFTHPNVDSYRYYARTIAPWLKREGFIPKNTKLHPILARFSMDESYCFADDLVGPSYVVPYIDCEDIPSSVRTTFENSEYLLQEWYADAADHLDIKKKLPKKDFLEFVWCLNDCRFPMRDVVSVLKAFLARLSAIDNVPDSVRGELERSYELAKVYDVSPAELGRYLENTAHLLQAEIALRGKFHEGESNVPKSVLIANRDVIRAAEQLVHPRNADCLLVALEQARKSLLELKDDREILKILNANMQKNISEAQKRLRDSSAEELQAYIGQYESADLAIGSETLGEYDDGRKISVYNNYSPQSVKYADISLGDGRMAAAGDLLTLHYTCALEDGTELISTKRRNQPLQVPLWGGYLLHGMELGLDGMRCGGVREFIVPPELGYASFDVAPIPTGHNLIYRVELLNVVPRSYRLPMP